jgi:hypothetical protein
MGPPLNRAPESYLLERPDRLTPRSVDLWQYREPGFTQFAAVRAVCMKPVVPQFILLALVQS